MSKIKIKMPYELDELTKNVPDLILNQDKIVQIDIKIDELIPSSDLEMNQKIAQKANIDVNELLSRPDYQILVDQFSTDLFKDIVGISTSYGFSEIQAWSLIALDFGYITNEF